MRVCVMVDGHVFYAAPSHEDAKTVMSGIITGNRWATSDNRGRALLSTEVCEGEPDPTPLADKLFWWDCNIGAHYSGWNAVPLDSRRRYDYEGVQAREKDNKRVIVMAADALDAIAKANLLLMKAKG
jgi:hypothetical protein